VAVKEEDILKTAIFGMQVDPSFTTILSPLPPNATDLREGTLPATAALKPPKFVFRPRKRPQRLSQKSPLVLALFTKGFSSFWMSS
jgi:hypothetical protein